MNAYRLLIALTLVLAGACNRSDSASHSPPASTPGAGVATSLTLAGEIQNDDIDEASGLVASRRDPALLWTMNDEGKPYLYAIDHDGDHRGRLSLDDATNRDWEDLAAFTLDGEPFIAVADIGDNEARRDQATIYVVREPDLSEDRKQKEDLAWRIDFTYEGGPRDAEAIAVDPDRQRFLLLSKREIPAALYELPLRPEPGQAVVARRLGPINSLPLPTQNDVIIAPRIKTWHWQPSAMDIAADGSAALILTYSAVYYYRRENNEDWFDTLQRAPLAFGLRGIREAESVAFAPGDRELFITIEGKHAPLFRIAIEGAPTP